MFEKVNPMHPDKISDRVGGAIVDAIMAKNPTAKIAGECLMGHGECYIIIETSGEITKDEVQKIVDRVSGTKGIKVNLKIVPQDKILAGNQSEGIRCGDNGIFKGVKVSEEEKKLTKIAKAIYDKYKCDGKYIYDASTDTLIVCQSNAKEKELKDDLKFTCIKNIVVNPLGFWTGGLNTDSSAVNRKLGSDMGRAVTGGGLHFKDISKADVSVNVFLHILANTGEFRRLNPELEALCAIGDSEVEIRAKYKDMVGYKKFKVPYKHITDVALNYIKELGGFEKLAEWGLIAP